MATTPVIDVFLSYAGEDGTCAMRVYDDLGRSGLKVWRYERDGDVGVDFTSEYRDAIQNARFFCLLDSSHARRSDHVQEECKLAISHAITQETPKLVPCLIEPIPNSGADWTTTELFPKQNQRTHIDLTDHEKGIKRLARHLGAVFYPGWEMPRDRDFEQEVYDLHLQPDQTQNLIDLYTKFLDLYESDLELGEAQLRVLIQECAGLHATNVISPRIALGVLQAKIGHHRSARKTFHDLAQDQPEDPRVWASLAGAQFYLADYETALSSYRKCRALLDGNPRTTRTVSVIGEMTHNTARVLLALGDPKAAEVELTTIDPSEAKEPYIESLRGRILMDQGDCGRALEYLEKAFGAYEKSSNIPISLVMDMADCYRTLERFDKELEVVENGMNRLHDDPEMWRRGAQCYQVQGDLARAINCMRQAISLDPDSVLFTGELALLFRLSGDTRRSEAEAERCLNLVQLCGTEHYYRGLAFHLLGQQQLADYEIGLSRGEPVIQTWPEYGDLVNPLSDPP